MDNGMLNTCCSILAKADIPYTSALERGTLKSKGGGHVSVHFCRDPQTVEVIIRACISVNQL